MFNLGAGEVLVILLVALIVLGPTRLPEAARTVGRVMGELRRMSTGFQNEMRDAFQDDNSLSPLDRRRNESKPLAATVEEADRGLADEPARPASASASATPAVAADSPRRRPGLGSGTASDGTASDGTTNGNGNGTAPADGTAAGAAAAAEASDIPGSAVEPVEAGEVPPEVADALDQISQVGAPSVRDADVVADATRASDDDTTAP